MNIDKLSDLPGSLPLFYKQVLNSWMQCGGCHSEHPRIFSEVRTQFIWGNRFICFRGKPLFYKHWMKKGILYINDLLNDANCISADFVYQKLHDKTNWLAEFYTLVHSIPKEWKMLLQTRESRLSKVKCRFVLRRYDQRRKGFVQDKCTSRLLYDYLVSKKYTKSYMETTWSRKFNCNYSGCEWKCIWNLSTNIQERKLAMLHFKMMHNILPCKLLLHRWRLADNPLCNVCNTTEDYEHLFVQCKQVQDAWKFLCSALAQIGIENIYPCLKFLVTGYKITQPAYTELNEILIIFTFGIFKSYCMSNNWSTPISVKTIVKRELCFRNEYYKTERRRLYLLKKVCDTI